MKEYILLARLKYNSLSGGWTLVSRFLMKDQDSQKETVVKSDSYREMLPNYNSNNQFLFRDGFNQLKNDMGFTQIRFYCFKKKRGRVFHIMTNKNSKGADVVKFLTKSNTMPRACGSFTRLQDDNSSLAQNCDKWGYPTRDRWGHRDNLKDNRMFYKAITWPFNRLFRFYGNSNSPLNCDDRNDAMSLGDTWQINVR